MTASELAEAWKNAPPITKDKVIQLKFKVAVEKLLYGLPKTKTIAIVRDGIEYSL